MSLVFNAEEILEIAVQIEKNGAAFYRRAAEIIEDPAAKKMLEELAAMEDGHEIIFENMRGDPDLLSQLLGDPDGPVTAYLRALAGGHIFNKNENPAAVLKKGVSMEEILKKAIQLEMTSIAFYHGIREKMPRELGRRKVGDIIHEEMKHVAMLTEKLSDLKAE